ncbi:uncharacterized protein LOC122289031 [Carya illinoinensis]|uniref:uncharacterized protein LOC122289031 n=1 Tax=Carya illinoinensis TaxID=32201 RepID=UPI001C7277A3|nr:uncharacterized protein LOC122289031 [Carya illinoinensis]
MHDQLKELAGKYDEMTKKMGGSSSVESLLNQTNLPYDAQIMAMQFPLKFKVPKVDMYNRSRDPVDHLENFKAHIMLHGFPGEIACRPFPLTLKGMARGWRHRRPTAYMLTVKQREDENLKAYLARFNKERLTTDDQDEKITLATLLGGLWPHSPFMAELARRTPSTLREFMDKADDFVNTDDTLQALVDPGMEDRRLERRSGQVDKKVKAGRRERVREGRVDHNPRLVHNNLGIREEEKERGGHRPIKTGSRYCKYHQTSSHWTEDYPTMKKRVVELAKTGELDRMVAERPKPRRH